MAENANKALMLAMTSPFISLWLPKSPEDVKSIGFDVLRHRVILSYEAEAEEIKAENIVQKVLDSIEVP